MKTLDELKRTGRPNPFKVPDGYFESLSEGIMARIEEQSQHVSVSAPPQHKSIRIMPWIWSTAVAACAVVALLLFNKPESNDQPLMAGNSTQQTEAYSEAYQQEVLDYAMVNNSDIENYLAGNF
jgi:hypothetical protein